MERFFFTWPSLADMKANVLDKTVLPGILEDEYEFCLYFPE